MRISIYALIRLSSFLLIILGMMGVTVSRLSPSEKPTWTSDYRQPWSVAQHLYSPVTKSGLILDTTSDHEIQIQASHEEIRDLVSISPFQDGDGNRQLVCRRQVFSGQGKDLAFGPVELARLRFPEGQLEDHRETDWLPNTAPVWDPRAESGLSCIFSTGAGELIRLDWTDSSGRKVDHRGVRIEWELEPPFGRGTFVAEPTWIPGDGNENRMVVSIWGIDGNSGYHVAGLAWLELDSARSVITNYGLLVQYPFQDKQDRRMIRYPSVNITRQGHMITFWYERNGENHGWKLKSAPLLRNLTRGEGLKLGKPDTMASGCLATPVGFNPETEYVYFVVPNSSDCYDGGNWHKMRYQEHAAVLVASRVKRIRSDQGSE